MKKNERSKKPSSSNNSNNENFKTKPSNAESSIKRHGDNRHPEWLNDDKEVKTMTFDESGKFVPVKVRIQLEQLFIPNTWP